MELGKVCYEVSAKVDLSVAVEVGQTAALLGELA